MAIFCKLGADGFIGTIVLLVLMLITQITGVFLIDKVVKQHQQIRIIVAIFMLIVWSEVPSASWCCRLGVIINLSSCFDSGI